jgi:hypothetical protein
LVHGLGNVGLPLKVAAFFEKSKPLPQGLLRGLPEHDNGAKPPAVAGASREKLVVVAPGEYTRNLQIFGTNSGFKECLAVCLPEVKDVFSRGGRLKDCLPAIGECLPNRIVEKNWNTVSSLSHQADIAVVGYHGVAVGECGRTAKGTPATLLGRYVLHHVTVNLFG